MGFRLKPPHQTDLERNHTLSHTKVSIQLSFAAKGEVTGHTFGRLYQPQGSDADLHLVCTQPVPPAAVQQPPQCPFPSLGHVNSAPSPMKTASELKLSFALVYLCWFNY